MTKLSEVNRLLKTFSDAASDAAAAVADLDTEEIHWTEAVPHSDSPGVYFLLSESDELLYIGKSENCVGARCWSHLRKDDSGEICWQYPIDGMPPPRRVAVLPLDRKHWFLAPAIESLLIRELRPRGNVVGRISGMILKDSHQIETLEDWRVHAGPKTPDQWVDHRSAKESARAWLRDGTAGIPSEIRALLASHPDFSEIARWEAEPEARVRFDSFRGEPSNLDVLLRAEDSSGPFIVGVEAKADETFSVILSDARSRAEARLEQNPRSKGLARIELLLCSLFGDDASSESDILGLRYQLCTATAAVLAEARRVGADRAVLVVHEFITRKTDDRLHRANAEDLERFASRISKGEVSGMDPGELHGPIDGSWLDGSVSSPRLYIGKAVSVLREAKEE